MNIKVIILAIFLPLPNFCMQSDTQKLCIWVKDEIGKKWILERIIPASLVAFAGYRYITEGCIDERCKNPVEPLVIAGVLAGHRPLRRLINAYTLSKSPQNSPRKIPHR